MTHPTYLLCDRDTDRTFGVTLLVRPDGTVLEATGTAPLLLEPVQAVFTLSGARPAEVNVLDPYGVPTGKAVPVSADGSVTIDGTWRSFYYEVKR